MLSRGGVPGGVSGWANAACGVKHGMPASALLTVEDGFVTVA